ncbi:UDP-3-O-[3-hydroxymyristoyl] N-acetylglucosamine deacetylase [Halanaerobacter jeridensis]|uniref:UDP-3-O-acyl-N-acetylglucosamine deacetylase n=2 Tax=Halanaerobacter jeridensis TaxID=706427 RepID=A0A938XX95_9FIRM|nr:UDP-3-O-[3-hydroxymyristoyl] N-acetylglucosamine deacetylase [Halanaerobacter jeridensis]
MERMQHTIKQKFSYTGIGLHTGQNVTITCYPLPPKQGIIFKRIDLDGEPEIKADVDNITSTNRCTTIGSQEADINTVEHFLSVINILEIDNLLVEIDANEPPVTDGSGKVFYDLFMEAGIAEQYAAKEIYQLDEAIYVKEGDQYLTVLPDEDFKISYTFVGDHESIPDQFFEYNAAQENYQELVAPARTFGFAHEVEKLQKAGLALGGSLDNAVLVDDDGPINKLRFEDEFARHKVLDLIGDMMLAPSFKGHIIAVRSGHTLNSKLAKKLKKKLLGRN